MEYLGCEELDVMSYVVVLDLVDPDVDTCCASLVHVVLVWLFVLLVVVVRVSLVLKQCASLLY